ncbi:MULTISPECIES: GNAT family N-acetyltransferase [unclassified Sphingopyxis]|uniref:GNAT family N-acetyltransferase n=1 Tax=unclassified Sphingopyxis TaxID=2614943 RepID=UPI0007315958|nr:MULTISPECIES: N-acetyltransferase [unclassified Sphingopyxis]KTE00321.1 GCN5 family acetyltransferase [Sphingopyxis sp. H012]KTE06686.1 GCN5 family acetyltransferase [Sphingopyxis sp. H053]KTE08814.1 GCN5 family acetyltransferase [Sphingopyxis sp. H093]KTE28816.1 GCN5 family acetyltransferase [Sphingopyxis sp. H080]KTE32732.1 GCN5 family acetyltransferase [Sphingopyxis sp. H038]KTE63393.1 GCN5 family acetyltransferase [Sphingopyxis sp. H085]
MVELLPLSDIEPQAVEDLLDAAFGTDRFGRTAYRIREGVDAVPELSFALVEDGALVGTIQCWPVALRAPDGGEAPLVMVGPVAIRPDVQRGGHGRALMAQMLDAAETQADGALMMIGDPEYYGRFFGFTADATGEWDLPGPFEKRRLLARAVNGHSLPTGAGMIGPR